MQINSSLSGNDANVLNALFDPESSISSGAPIDASRNGLPHVHGEELPSLQAIEAQILRPLSAPTTDRRTIAAAIVSLDQLVHKHPSYASAYINRAQVNRLKLDDGMYTVKDSEVVALILADLSKAIDLLMPSSPSESASMLQARLLATAHTHRAFVLYKTSKTGDISCLPEPIRNAGVEAVAEMASRDFRLGGTYGDTVAQQMSVRTNPYAKLCGAIVKEAMRKEMSGKT